VISSTSPITDTAIVKTKTVKPIVKSGSNLVLEGMASYYSKAGCLGCNPLFVMANGQQLDDNALTMAIGADKSHLVGYQARVTNLANGKSVIVRITDTGGFYQDKYGNRVADLTIGTKTAIGMNGGLGKVRIEVL
jgi:rare lipoprotein A